MFGNHTPIVVCPSRFPSLPRPLRSAVPRLVAVHSLMVALNFLVFLRPGVKLGELQQEIGTTAVSNAALGKEHHNFSMDVRIILDVRRCAGISLFMLESFSTMDVFFVMFFWGFAGAVNNPGLLVMVMVTADIPIVTLGWSKWIHGDRICKTTHTCI